MKRILTTLADKQETLIWAIVFAGIPTFGACLTGVVGIHFRGHGACQCGFVGKDTV